MISLAILLTLLGFLSCYHSSRKAKFSVHYSAQKWLKDHPGKANYLGLLGMLLGLCLCFLSLGWFVGFLSFLMILSLVVSLSIILIPLKVLQIKWVGILFFLFLITEIYFSYYAGK